VSLELLAAVVGQDLEKGDDGRLRIARRVAPDRIISTVDPEARHDHKTSARGFDGYEGHIAIDPDAEIITSMKVTTGNVGDGAVATALLGDCLPLAGGAEGESAVPEQAEPVEVYGDSAYGAGAVLSELDRAGALAMVKVQAASAPQGRFTKDQFVIDIAVRTRRGRWYPRQELNLRTRFRKPLLYPLSYGGGACGSRISRRRGSDRTPRRAFYRVASVHGGHAASVMAAVT
jgi:hypothetical protein